MKIPPPVWEWEKRRDWEWEQDKENFLKMSNQATDAVSIALYNSCLFSGRLVWHPIGFLVLTCYPSVSTWRLTFYFQMVNFTESTLESLLSTADLVRAVRLFLYITSCHVTYSNTEIE